MCKITLGRIVVAARRNQELSQRELAKLITDKMVRRIVDATKTTPQPNQYQLAQLANRFSFDFRELSKIENDHVEIRGHEVCRRLIAITIGLSSASVKSLTQMLIG